MSAGVQKGSAGPASHFSRPPGRGLRPLSLVAPTIALALSAELAAAAGNARWSVNGVCELLPGPCLYWPGDRATERRLPTFIDSPAAMTFFSMNTLSR
jgi:hypothetical protein